MERKDAELLIDELAKHPRVIPFDKGIFIDELFLTEVKDSSRFYEGLPYREQSSRESMDCYYVLSLRRVLRNRNAGDYKLSFPKKLWDEITHGIRVYDSNILTRRIRADNDLIQMMLKNKNPFSLLCKLETFEDREGSKTNFITRMPMLIIPNIEDKEKIRSWEEENTTYGKEVGVLLRHEKRISERSYRR